MIQDARPIGSRCWFEYHCWESHESGDAQVWYRSHQQCTIIGYSNANEVPETFEERVDAAMLLVYRVQFDDGLEWDTFEDELLDSPDEFERPDPPKVPSHA